MDGNSISQRALAFVGTPFRIGGRHPGAGVDCIGLAALALNQQLPLPSGYRLQSASADRWHRWFEKESFARVPGQPGSGDLVLVRSGPIQFHLMVTVPGGYVHAHAGLRRVVFLPGVSLWPIVSVWRAPFISGD